MDFEDDLAALSARRRRMRYAAWAVGVVVAIAAAASVAGWLIVRHSSSPVPKAMAAGLSFPVYYPVQDKLPSGYALDLNSFKQPVHDGLNYTVTYPGGHKLVFSLQAKPSTTELQTFTANYIPLHNTLQTLNGQAMLGAYNTKTGTQTLVSFPTNSNTWIIITAPYDVNQDQLKQVLNALTTE